MTPWLTVIGVGVDGLDDLPPALRALIDIAEVLTGGDRQLEMAPFTGALRIPLQSPIAAALDKLAEHRGRRAVRAGPAGGNAACPANAGGAH